MDIYLIRHGETDYNKGRRLQGVTDIPLNERGIALAEQTAIGLKGIEFDKIFTSPLVRARRTAEIIRGERKIPIIVTDGLREISFGDYEGLTVLDGAYNIPDPHFLDFFNAPQKYQTPPNGESIAHMSERTAGFVKGVLMEPENRGKTILMASHGAAIRGVLSGLFKVPIEKFWGGGVHKNCAVTLLRGEGLDFEIVFENRVYY